MCKYRKRLYGVGYELRKASDGVFELYAHREGNEVEFLHAYNNIHNIRGMLMEHVLDNLYSIKLGQVVLKQDFLEAYYKVELFMLCFEQEME